MRDEVYEYLHDYGFSAIELDKIEKENQEMFNTDLSEVKKNIAFLEEKYIPKEDIISIVNSNPFMLTEKNNRLEAVDSIYDDLNIDYESLIMLVKTNPKAYTISPVELNKIINYLKEKNYSNEAIKTLVLKNPSIISMKFDKFTSLL